MAKKFPSSDSDLVAAALSTLTDNFIVSQREHDKQHKDKAGKWKKHDITVGHSESIQLSGASKIFDAENINGVFIHDKNGQLYPIPVDIGTDKVTDLKSKIEKVCGVCVEQQSLIYGGEVLRDTDTLNESSVCNQATLFLTYEREAPAPARARQYLDNRDLAPEFNFDLTNCKDDGVEYRRGGGVYKRPYGWNRIALNVLGRYSSDIWLGLKGVRTRESPGEWLVSFYGVMEVDFLRRHGKVGTANRVHSTPDIDCVEFEQFVRVFMFGGVKFKAVYQNRVNSLNLVVTDDGHFVCNIGDVRPYGICVKQIL